MPLLDNKLAAFRCKLFGFSQLANLEPLRLSQFHGLLYLKDRLAAAVAHVNVNRPVIVAVKEKSVPILFKHLWHVRNVVALPYKRDPIFTRLAPSRPHSRQSQLQPASPHVYRLLKAVTTLAMPLARSIIIGFVTAAAIAGLMPGLLLGEWNGPINFGVPILVITSFALTVTAFVAKPRGWSRGLVAGVGFATPIAALCFLVPRVFPQLFWQPRPRVVAGWIRYPGSIIVHHDYSRL